MSELHGHFDLLKTVEYHPQDINFLILMSALVALTRQLTDGVVSIFDDQPHTEESIHSQIIVYKIIQ